MPFKNTNNCLLYCAEKELCLHSKSKCPALSKFKLNLGQ